MSKTKECMPVTNRVTVIAIYHPNAPVEYVRARVEPGSPPLAGAVLRLGAAIQGVAEGYVAGIGYYEPVSDGVYRLAGSCNGSAKEFISMAEVIEIETPAVINTNTHRSVIHWTEQRIINGTQSLGTI